MPLPQKYLTLDHFVRHHKILLPRGINCHWRLTDRVVGEIQGLQASASRPGSRGVLTATNGILCYIEQIVGGQELLFLGHIGWFIADQDEDRALVRKDVSDSESPAAKSVAKELDILEALGELEL